MTRLDELKAMSDEDLSLRVAEQVMGFTPRMVRVSGSTGTVECWTKNTEIHDGVWTEYELIRYGKPLPYAEDYNDAALVCAEIERRGLGVLFIKRLLDVVLPSMGIDSYVFGNLFKLINATPREICIAAILTVEVVK